MRNIPVTENTAVLKVTVSYIVHFLNIAVYRLSVSTIYTLPVKHNLPSFVHTLSECGAACCTVMPLPNTCIYLFAELGASRILHWHMHTTNAVLEKNVWGQCPQFGGNAPKSAAPSGERPVGWGMERSIPSQPIKRSGKRCELPKRFPGEPRLETHFGIFWRPQNAPFADAKGAFCGRQNVDALRSSNSVSCIIRGQGRGLGANPAPT